LDSHLGDFYMGSPTFQEFNLLIEKMVFPICQLTFKDFRQAPLLSTQNN